MKSTTELAEHKQQLEEQNTQAAALEEEVASFAKTWRRPRLWQLRQRGVEGGEDGESKIGGAG